jgi:hypothetical protein
MMALTRISPRISPRIFGAPSAGTLQKAGPPPTVGTTARFVVDRHLDATRRTFSISEASSIARAAASIDASVTT